MTCAIAFHFYSFLINIQSKQAEQIIHTVDTHMEEYRPPGDSRIVGLDGDSSPQCGRELVDPLVDTRELVDPLVNTRELVDPLVNKRELVDPLVNTRGLVVTKITVHIATGCNIFT